MRAAVLILFGAALLLPIWTGPSRAAEPEIWLPGAGGNPADIDRDVLWLDNPDYDGSTGSSEVLGGTALWTEVATDFVLEEPATIRKVSWWGGYWSGFEEPTGAGFNLRFYYDADCLPEDAPFLEYLLMGDDCCETLAEGGDMFTQYVYEHCFDLPLPQGLYWFSAQMANHQFPPQWGRLEADREQACESAFRSPYFAYVEWVPAGVVEGIFEPWDGSQMIENVCEATAIENASWGAIKGLYR